MNGRLYRAIGCLAVLAVTGWTFMHAGDDGDNGGRTRCIVPMVALVEGPDPVSDRCVEEPQLTESADVASYDVALDPRSGSPIVVWAEQVAEDHDLAFRRWLGDRWSTRRYLTSTSIDDRDPRLAAAASDVHLVWWDEAQRVLYSRLDAATGTWTGEQLVTIDGRRPAIAVVGGRPLIAFERDAAGGGHEVFVARARRDGGFSAEVVASIAGGEAPAVAFYCGDERLWLAWRVDDRTAAYSELDATGWSRPLLRPWTGPWGEQALPELIGR